VEGASLRWLGRRRSGGRSPKRIALGMVERLGVQVPCGACRRQGLLGGDAPTSNAAVEAPSVPASDQSGTVRGLFRLAIAFGTRMWGRLLVNFTLDIFRPTISLTLSPQQVASRKITRFWRVFFDRAFRFRSATTSAISERARIRMGSMGLVGPRGRLRFS